MSLLRHFSHLIIFLFVLLSLACAGPEGDCDPQTDPECASNNPSCDPNVDPGCEVCEPQSAEALCASNAILCGPTQIVDDCNETREIDCGECLPCIGESDGEFCAAGAISCGPAEFVDRCGDTRSIDCGPCPCERESDVELCAREALACGRATAVDGCGDSRVISCGSCPAGEDCRDNQCACEPESSAALCAAAGSQCGPLTSEDGCGQVRNIHCGDCRDFEATLGAVRDARTGAFIGSATMHINSWPARGGEDGLIPWPAGYRYHDAEFIVSTADRGRGGANYEFIDGFGTCVEGRIDAQLSRDGWYRIRIDLPGYAPGIFYRYHWGYDAECAVQDCGGLSHGGQCRVEDFELWPLNAPYPLYPDLMIDPRDLSDQQWQCAIMPDDAPHPYLIGLRHTAGATNVGMGPLHLRGVGQDGQGGGRVYQRIVWSDGRMDERLLPQGAFEFSETHGHIHFQAFVDMYLADPRPECMNPFNRPAGCVMAQERRKVSWCLMDDTRFDREILADYSGEQSYIYPSVCENFIQGITQGWKDYYDKSLPGQVVVIGPPQLADSLGPRWLEVMIDPADFLFEMTRQNNISRILVEAPAPTMSLCQSRDALDCSGNPDNFGFTQRRQCRAYLQHGN